MKYLPTILSVVALIGVGVLFFRQSDHVREQKTGPASEKVVPAGGFKIAYFDMDTLETHYDVFKEAQTTVKAKESAMNQELASMDRKNQKQVAAWREKGQGMTQAEG